jgi:hypothetical protein
MRIAISAITLFTVLAGTGIAMAEDDHNCGNAAQSQWMSTDAIKAKFAADGNDVRRIKVEGGCYEVYAVSKDGRKMEQVVDPVTGNVVGREGDDE